MTRFDDFSVILIRGAPGSGKTTLARQLGRIPVEADGYFEIGDFYFFDPSKLTEAHQRCFWMAEKAVERGLKVAVCNTFSRFWEIKDYVRRWPDAPIIRCDSRFANTHNVPAATVEKIRSRMAPIKNEIMAESLLMEAAE